jgi:hypothetical protein
MYMGLKKSFFHTKLESTYYWAFPESTYYWAFSEYKIHMGSLFSRYGNKRSFKIYFNHLYSTLVTFWTSGCEIHIYYV